MRTASMLCLLLLAACTAPERTSAREPVPQPAMPATSQAGWYMQRAGQASFQPCGQSQPLRIVAAADLPARAKAFGLDDDTPVYVRLKATIEGSDLRVSAVEQFGSTIPVRDCAMTGVVIPSPRS